MTRTIELHAEFEGTDHNFALDFDDGVTIRIKAYESEPGKYLAMSIEDFEKIAVEYERFKRLNKLVAEAA